MLNKLISILFLFVFFNIKTVNSETNFLLPKEKPSIFQKVKNQITENSSRSNLAQAHQNPDSVLTLLK